MHHFGTDCSNFGPFTHMIPNVFGGPKDFNSDHKNDIDGLMAEDIGFGFGQSRIVTETPISSTEPMQKMEKLSLREESIKNIPVNPTEKASTDSIFGPLVTPERPTGFGAKISGGFGVSTVGIKSAGYMKNIKDPWPRMGATFIPPEEKYDDLFNNRIIPGSLKENVFLSSNVVVSRAGMTHRTSVDFLKSFDNISLTAQIRENITERCKYINPTPVQQYTMPVISGGFDLLACAQTGSGKTAAFLLPVISKLLEKRNLANSNEPACFPRCLVIVPTRELAHQIQTEGKRFAYSPIQGFSQLLVHAIYGGTNVDYCRKQVLKGISILIATPGRLLHFLEDGTISLEKLRFLILDEADRMLDMGFKPDIKRVHNYINFKIQDVQTVMFSATFPSAIQSMAQEFLKKDYTMVTVDKIGVANKCISQSFINCEFHNKKDVLLHLLGLDLKNYTVTKDDIFNKKTLVLVSLKTQAETLAALLCEASIPTTYYCSLLEQAARAWALREFSSGRKAVMVASAISERGLDIMGVDHVINFDLPQDIDQYIHRIGRTGRIGNPGRATSLYTPKDIHLVPDMVRILTEADQEIPDFLLNIVGNDVRNNARIYEKDNGTEEEGW